jgi:agmatine deiminase
VCQVEDAVDQLVADEYNSQTSFANLVSEGSNRESNGAGCLLMVSAVERARNPNLKLAQIEDRHRTALGIKKIIWLPYGSPYDDPTTSGPLANGAYTAFGTGGHVDQVARFVNPTTILVGEVSASEAKADPIMAEYRRRLEANLKVLQSATDTLGHRFHILRMPVPSPIVSSVSRTDALFQFCRELTYKKSFPRNSSAKVVEASSYLSFLVSNGVVLAPKFWKPGRPESLKRKDGEALRILSSQFSGRKVIAIDAEALNLGGVGLHAVGVPVWDDRKPVAKGHRTGRPGR